MSGTTGRTGLREPCVPVGVDEGEELVEFVVGRERVAGHVVEGLDRVHAPVSPDPEI
ncbi:hypothetical protein [Pseudonocardia parietis]|uniref:Uncharacterized protein n=1 Tax=Pseudonocardia parietis TaxID=570936 RepID=A0ABS4VNV4_9PSEU|nr:hypothetical protein [Pseudonocardia parietis]MBP2365596.1 hypothetical protein [Pseudonocardia parietis]